MNKLKLLPLLFLLAACGSKPTAEEETPSHEQIKAAEAPKSDLKKTPPAPTKPVATNILNDAIKSQNDEQIYRAATGTLINNPSYTRAMIALGNYHYRKNQPLAAQYFYAKALQLNSRLSEAHSNMGLTYLSLGEKRQAIKEFRKAIEENSNDYIAAANLGSIYAGEKDYIKASVLLEIAVKKIKDPKILNNYAVSLAGIGKYDQAKGLYKDALDKNSSNREVLFNYAILLIEHLNEPQDGLDQINKLKFLGPSEYMKNRIIALENKAKAGVK
jgi:tetratricopeptide (TPR) repeat protein